MKLDLTRTTDEQIINTIMSSNFEEYDTRELRMLLLRFRALYGYLIGKNNHIAQELDKKNKELEVFKINHEKIINDLLFKNANLENEITFRPKRKLTIKERITGKI